MKGELAEGKENKAGMAATTDLVDLVTFESWLTPEIWSVGSKILVDHEKIDNRACPDLRICYYFVDHRSAKFYGNQKSPTRRATNKTNFSRSTEVIS